MYTSIIYWAGAMLWVDRRGMHAYAAKLIMIFRLHIWAACLFSACYIHGRLVCLARITVLLLSTRSLDTIATLPQCIAATPCRCHFACIHIISRRHYKHIYCYTLPTATIIFHNIFLSSLRPRPYSIPTRNRVWSMT